jgi:cytochrome c biogenesis protein CcdA
MLLLPIAFISGLLTALSPCVLPILPIILASSVDGKKTRTNGIIVGLILGFVFFTLALTALVTTLGVPADFLRTLAVILLALFGFTLLFPTLWDQISARLETLMPKTTAGQNRPDFLGGLLTGLTLGLVWTPCVGPIVATVATLSALNQFSLTTVLLVTSFALGISVPLWLIAQGGRAFITRRLSGYQAKSTQIRRLFGLIIIATAVLIASGFERRFQSWALDRLPAVWSNIPVTFENLLNVNPQLQDFQMTDSPSAPTQPGQTIINKNISLALEPEGAKVPLNQLDQGCFGQDCIPSIDNPQFESASSADTWLDSSDVVFALDFHDQQRAYPQRIMNWHEIVNDTIDNQPVVVTFCPLCGSALAFNRQVNEVVTQFGVSGKLHNSDLVMYDRFEGSLWQQITGEAIVGPAARRDEFLSPILITTTTWQEWKSQFPNTQVLSRDTGFNRDYNRYPYGTYEQDDQIYFGVQNTDRRLPLKQIIYGVELNGSSKAYPLSTLEQTPVIQDFLGDIAFQITRQPSGEVTITNFDTDQEIIPLRTFWFAWAAFHPETELYQP